MYIVFECALIVSAWGCKALGNNTLLILNNQG